MPLDIVVAQADAGGLNHQFAASWHGVARISREVHDHLLDLHGSAFTFPSCFPLSSPALEEHLTGCETVLLAEDEAAIRESTREFLRLNGYIVLEARNGMEALAARDYKGPIQLMITDVVMPQMSGAKLAEDLAAERPQMKVLFVSGYAENTVLRHAKIDVTSRFLQKPFSLTALARKVREVLDPDVPALTATAAST
jgi:two-component system, cell cycle sensor histidine kinase and response regulator CckA